MEITSASVPSPAGGEAATLFVVLELSKARWLVAIHSPRADKISRHTIEGGDAPALLNLIGRMRDQAQHHLGTPVRVVSCFEAGYDGFWLHRVLVAHGIENHVMDPASLPVDRRTRRVKTDRLDLGLLMRALMAWCRGEPQVCRMVRVPTPEEEDCRRRSRERERLVNERVQHIGRIKGLLMTQGIRDDQPTRTDWRRRLDELRTGDGQTLPPHLKAELEREGRRLWLVMDMLAELEATRDQDREEPATKQALALSRFTGIGPTSAHVLGGEVFHREFGNRRELAAYFGLAPSHHSSGTVHRDQGIAKSGNARARRVAVEVAWLWLRFQPGSTLSRWFHERSGAGRGRMRRVLIVALARKLMIALWRYLAIGIVPEGALLKS